MANTKAEIVEKLVTQLYEQVTNTAEADSLDFGECMNALNALVEAFITNVNEANQSTTARVFCQMLLQRFEPLRNDNLWPPKQQVALALQQIDPNTSFSADGQRVDCAIAAVCHVMSNPPSMLTRPLNS